MATKQDWNHKARSGDHGRLFGFKHEPEVWRDSRGWNVAGELLEGGRVIITDRRARKRTTRRKRKPRRAGKNISTKYNSQPEKNLETSRRSREASEYLTSGTQHV